MPETQKYHPVTIVNQTMRRLPLVLDILDELETEPSSLGDDELRQGCSKAVRNMVERLQRIPELPMKDAGKEPTTNEIQIATTWLLGERPRRLLPADLHEELSTLIEKLVPGTREVMSGKIESTP